MTMNELTRIAAHRFHLYSGVLRLFDQHDARVSRQVATTWVLSAPVEDSHEETVDDLVGKAVEHYTQEWVNAFMAPGNWHSVPVQHSVPVACSVDVHGADVSYTDWSAKPVVQRKVMNHNPYVVVTTPHLSGILFVVPHPGRVIRWCPTDEWDAGIRIREFTQNFRQHLEIQVSIAMENERYHGYYMPFRLEKKS